MTREREERNAYARSYYAQNADRLRKYMRDYQRANAERIRAYAMEWRARKRARGECNYCPEKAAPGRRACPTCQQIQELKRQGARGVAKVAKRNERIPNGKQI